MPVITLQGRTIKKQVKPVIGATILELAQANKVDWLSNCKRGTCARCRSLVIEGMDCLSIPNEAEINRLEQDELAQGYRLGCQAKIIKAGPMSIKHASYF